METGLKKCPSSASQDLWESGTMHSLGGRSQGPLAAVLNRFEVNVGVRVSSTTSDDANMFESV